jgi:hypothetical protein
MVPAVLKLPKAISSKDYPHLAGLFAALRRCGSSDRARLCAFRRALKANKNPPRLGNIIFGKRLSSRSLRAIQAAMRQQPSSLKSFM